MLVIVDYGIGNLRSIEKAFQAVGADVKRSDRAEDIARADRVVLPGVGAFGACAAEIRRRRLEEPVMEAIASGKPFLGVCVGMQLLFEIGEEMGRHQGLGVLPGRVVRFSGAMSGNIVSCDVDANPGAATAGGFHSNTGPASSSLDTEEAHGVSQRAGATVAGDETPARPTLGDAGDPQQVAVATPPLAGALKVPHMGWNTISPQRSNPLLDGIEPNAFFYFVHSFHAAPENPADVLASTRYGVDFPAIVQRNLVYGVQFHPEKSQRNGLRILSNFANLPH